MDDLENDNSSRPSLGPIEHQDASFAQRMFHTALIVDKYYTPLLFLFGTLGNTLSLAVFCMNAKYRNQSASYYLSALAISDTGFLISLLAVWLEGVHGGVITSGLMCPLVMYLGQVTCFMSVYLTVAFSIERFVAVHYPLSRPRICTRSKAKKVIAALTLVALLVFSYVGFIAQVIELPSSEEFADVQREKRATFSIPITSSTRLQTFPEEEVSRTNGPFARMWNCTNGNNIHNELPGLNSPNEFQNCSRLHLEEILPTGFEPAFSGESSEELSSNTQSNAEREQSASEEQLYLGGGYICTVPNDYYRISEIANYLDSIITLIIPFFLITFFNVRIAVCVWKLRDQRQNIVAKSTPSINHHHSLRCSNKSSIHHNRCSKVKRSSLNRKKHFLQKHTISKENGTGEKRGLGGKTEGDLEDSAMYCGSQRGNSQVRFQVDASTCNRFATTGQSNNTTSSSSGSEENSQADTCDYDNVSPRTSIHSRSANHGINVTTERLSAAEAGSAFFGKPSSFGRFGGSVKWDEKPASLSTRLTIKPELSTVRQRTSSQHHPSSNAAEVRVTKTLLLVSSVFLVLNLPAHDIRCAHFIQSLRGTSEGQELLQAAQPWTNILFNTNFAVNFLLYCVSGRNFRKSLRNIVLRKFSKSSTAWKPGVKCKREGIPIASKLVGAKRNCAKELHVTEVVELEERGEDSTYPNNRTALNCEAGVEEDEESMSV